MITKLSKDTFLAAVSSAAMFAGLSVAAPALAVTCQFAPGGPNFGIEPPLRVDGTCEDPDYNANTFVIDSVTTGMQSVSATTEIPYTQVNGHFPATHTLAQLPGVIGSPTLVQHGVVWRFPMAGFWQNRFFQATYPLAGDSSAVVDPVFAFTHGAYTVQVIPGNPLTGYRVNAAAAKLAKAYANTLYGNSKRIYGYTWGASGGSIQLFGELEGTTGVWDGGIPYSTAPGPEVIHNFGWEGLYALAVPAAQQAAVAAAVKAGTDIYAGLNAEQQGVLNELLNGGYALRTLETSGFFVGLATITANNIPDTDPTYENDFWTVPGYEGANPPDYLAAAKVDGFATITGITRNASNVPTSITFDPATVPALGSIGSTGLQYYVYAADGVTRTIGTPTLSSSTGTLLTPRSLTGTLSGNTLTLTGTNDPTMLGALAVGGEIRINNRFLLAMCFYQRHSIQNGNPAYNQYLSANGTPIYPQRSSPAWQENFIATSGGILQSGHIKFQAMIVQNLMDNLATPLGASFYDTQVNEALGGHQADEMFRIYYNDSANHSSTGTITGSSASYLVGFGGLLNQAILDLANWVELGTNPKMSSNYSVAALDQISLPEQAVDRRGLQPVVTLSVNGADNVLINEVDHASVAANTPVTLTGEIQVPPSTGQVLQFDWYLGGTPVTYGTPTVLTTPQALVKVAKQISFPTPGTYELTLRTASQRNGVPDTETETWNLRRLLINVQ